MFSPEAEILLSSYILTTVASKNKKEPIKLMMDNDFWTLMLPEGDFK